VMLLQLDAVTSFSHNRIDSISLHDMTAENLEYSLTQKEIGKYGSDYDRD